MNRIFNPSIRLMNKLKYIQKFNLIFIIFLLPITVMMLIGIIQVNKEFNFVKKQRMGLEYNITLRTLIQHVQQHRGLTSIYIGGRTDLKPSILLKEDEIEKDFKEVNKINDKYKNNVNVDEQWQKINKQWPSIKSLLLSTDLKEAYDSHTKFIGEMLDLNTLVSNNSELIIQNRVESYYLVDAIVDKLPMVTEYMGQSRAIGASVAIKRTLSEGDKQHLLLLEDNITKNLNDTTKGMSVAYNNPKIKNILELPISNAFGGVDQIIELLNKEILNAKQISIDPNEYFNLSTSAINKIYDLLITESNVVLQISNDDVNSLALKRNLLISFTFVILTFIVYLFAGFYYSVIGSISIIEKASGMIAAGVLTERVQLEAKDETLKIGNALNRMLDTLTSNLDEVKNAQNTLERLAHYDFLTGLPNRSFFMEHLNKAIEFAEKNNKVVAVLFIDLDKFKAINDTLGHQMGDVVLKTVAAQLSGIAGEKSIVSRLGGDEFTILLPEITDNKEIIRLCDKIVETIERPLILNQNNYYIGASIGYAIYPTDAHDGISLLNKADLAMYNVKQKRKEASR